MTGRDLNRRTRGHDWRTDDICAAVIEDAEALRAEPEGLPLLVLTDDEATARKVAPMMGEACYPGRSFGDVLHVEPLPGERYGLTIVYEVTLQVR